MWSYTYPSRAQSEQLQTTRMTAMLVGMVNAAERIPLVSYMPFAGTVTEWAKNAASSDEDDDDDNSSTAPNETSSDDGRLEHLPNEPPLPEPTVSFSTPLPRKNTFTIPNQSTKIEEDQDQETPSRLPSLIPRLDTAKRSLRSSISTPNLRSKYASPPPPYQPSLLNPTESIGDSSKHPNGASASATLRERLKIARLSMPLFGGSEPGYSAPASPTSDTKSLPSRRPSTASTDLPKTRINRRALDQAITLTKIAAAEDEKGNTQLALDLYLTGLEQMLSAYPLAESSARRALDSKLRSFCERNHLSELNSIALASKAGPSRLAQLSDLMINLAIFIAITIKQSPLPDTVYSTFKLTFKTLQSLDEKFSLSERAWDLTASGVNKALEIDAKYNLHQVFSQALITTAAAIVKAGIAYKDSPSWKDMKNAKDIKLDALEFSEESLEGLLSELGRRGSAV